MPATATLPEKSPGARKLEALLTHLEDGLRSESFHLAARDMTALLELLPRQTQTLRTALGLFQQETFAPRTRAAFIERITAVRRARENISTGMRNLTAETETELAEMRRVSARLRRIRETTSTTRSPAEPAIRGWA